jgi:acyl dehydratase
VTQELVDRFAEATGDRQWIHVDVERARRESVFGGTVAHGYLTLALLPSLTRTAVTFAGASTAVNYGLNRLRFPAPCRVGASVRLVARLLGVEEVRKPPDGGEQAVLTTWGMTMTADGSTKPVCVAEVVTQFYFDVAAR